jgi:hypothetical protein
MNFKEIEGKRYIEFNNVLIVVLTALVCFVIAFCIIGYVLYQNSEAIINDPLIFGAKVYNVSQCYCINTKGVDFGFNQETVWRKADAPVKQEYNFNYTNMQKYFNNGTTADN